VPEELRGTYAGLAHPATLEHLLGLGVTAVELLPVQARADEPQLARRGLRNYWGYNTLAFFAPSPGYAAAHRAVTRAAAQVSGDGENLVVAAATADDALVLVRETATTNAMTGEVVRSSSRGKAVLPAGVTSLVLDVAQANLYAGLVDGRIGWFRVDGGGTPAELLLSLPSPTPISALTLLIGDRSLVVGRTSGAIEVWFPLLRGKDRSLRHVRSFPALPAAVIALAPSPRGKGFLALDASGALSLMYSTSERVLWSGKAPVAEATAIAYAPKADGALVAGTRDAAALAIAAPHPEVSLKALFGKVWYEGYAQPEQAWQSSSGTEDFEPKLSLTPLLFGTLKGTFYSLLLAVPFGVLSAMYASQFLHPSLRRIVKPVVEIMASLPSVVLGFLAGLWLAPLLAHVLPALAVMVLVLPPTIVLAGLTWERWWRLAQAAEDLGYESLCRSDHLTGLGGESKRPSLETWVSLTDAGQFVTGQKIDFTGKNGIEILGGAKAEPLEGTFLVSEIDTAHSRVRLMDVVNRAPLKTQGTFAGSADVATYYLVGPNYFYFFIVVMSVMGVIFIFVAMAYKEKTHVRMDA
jgi:ABC-type uncharacterized transport system permease subunit